MSQEPQLQICEVCRRLDRDYSLKQCTYCNFCHAWICENDLHDWFRRFRAARTPLEREIAQQQINYVTGIRT